MTVSEPCGRILRTTGFEAILVGDGVSSNPINQKTFPETQLVTIRMITGSTGAKKPVWSPNPHSLRASLLIVYFATFLIFFSTLNDQKSHLKPSKNIIFETMLTVEHDHKR